MTEQRNPIDLKFVFVVGKGGVGKSVVSAALATAAARRGKRVLVAMCNAKERLSIHLEVKPIGAEIRNVAEGIDAVNMEPTAALEEYGLMILKVRALYKLIFENRFVSAFLRGTPGIEAWAMLGKAQFHAFETRPDGTPRYDLVIVDAPATGHGLDLLRVPKVIIDTVPPGLLRNEADRAWSLFSDPQRAGVYLVSLAEELPTNETIELHDAVRAELGLPICGLAINQLVDPLFSDEDRTQLDSWHPAHSDKSDLAQLWRVGAARANREQDQERYVTRLQEGIAGPTHRLRALPAPEIGRAEVETLSHAFD